MVFDGGGIVCIGSYFRAGRLSSYCCVESLRGNHIKFRPRVEPLLSSLILARACKYRGIRNLYRAMYANWKLSTPPTPSQRPEEQTPKTAETHDTNPCASKHVTLEVHVLDLSIACPLVLYVCSTSRSQDPTLECAPKLLKATSCPVSTHRCGMICRNSRSTALQWYVVLTRRRAEVALRVDSRQASCLLKQVC